MNYERDDLTSEIILVREAVSGSKEAFCSLYGKYKDKLYRYALYRLGNPEDAEDAVSECVLAAWQGLPRLKKAESFGVWIFRILHRCCAGRISEAISLRDNLRNIYEADERPSGKAAPSVSVELAEALGLLSDDEREIVLLSVLAGLTSSEISEITSLTPGSVRSSLSRSLAKMRAFLS